MFVTKKLTPYKNGWIQLRPMMLAYTLQVGMPQLESGPFQVKSNCSSNQYALFASFGVFGMCFKNEDQVVYENNAVLVCYSSTSISTAFDVTKLDYGFS
jgi:hypothetical protein